MDVVYISGPHSKHNDIEMKYSIRSLVKHLNGLSRIFVVGHCPAFVKAFHIPAGDPYQYNYARNIYEKILLACNDRRVSSKFLCIHPDHYLLSNFSIDSFPVFVNAREKTLQELTARITPQNYYKPYVDSTIKVLLARDLPTVNYNVHTPIVYDKKAFKTLMAQYDWTGKKGFIAKSLYGNTLQLTDTVPVEDFKIQTPKEKKAIYRKIFGKQILSTNEFSMNQEMKDVLWELYPDPSKWEV